jgi:hypothetical protein
VLTAVAAAGLVHPVRPTPAALALATTNSWVLAFDVSAALLLAAAIVTGVLVRTGRAQPAEAVQIPTDVSDLATSPGNG